MTVELPRARHDVPPYESRWLADMLEWDLWHLAEDPTPEHRREVLLSWHRLAESLYCAHGTLPGTDPQEEFVLWEVWTYDVWGHTADECADGGCEFCGDYLVNGRSCEHRTLPMSADPTDDELREALSVRPDVAISTDGDDTVIYVNCADDGWPIGEVIRV